MPVRTLHAIGDSKFGGGSVIILRLMELGLQMGHQVEVLATDDRFCAESEAIGVRCVRLDVIRREIRPIFDWRGTQALARYLRENRYDLVHTHTSKAGFIGRRAAWMAGCPRILHTVHGFAFHERSNPVSMRLFVALERMAARWCHRLVTVSEFHRDWAVRLGIAPPEKIVAIPNGISPERVKPARTPDDVRRELGIGPDQFVIASIGRLAKGKGLEELVSILPDIRLAKPGAVLLLPGEGNLKFEGEGIIAPGFRTDIGDLLNIADLVALPSHREGLSIALLEAMAAGKPIVASDLASNIEAAEGAAEFVSVGDKAQLCRTILQLISHSDRAQQLGQAAKQRFEERYTERRMIEQYRDLYQFMLGAELAVR
ncbi:MAG: glycosyltransferase family 4 protein [Armatimonadetes bacterium]|nr:glycosyltransferase family 4 protein [Armatimonadota bacterium]